MKPILKKVLFISSFLAVFTLNIQAKPAYCTAALIRCWDICEDTIFTAACQTGCNIGYLMCG